MSEPRDEVHTRFPIGDGYRIVPFDEQHAISGEDVVALWAQEGVVSAEEGERRMHEIVMVAQGPGDELAGVSTAYIATHPQLGMPLWHYRAFVAPAHRRSALSIWLAREGRDHLESRFVTRQDQRGAGVVFEMQNRGLEQAFPEAHWWAAGVWFVGRSAGGDRVRVHYFPGVLAPDPPR